MKIHTIQEYKTKVPFVSDEDYLKLKKDIEKRGLQEQITVNQDGVVLDGHHRFRALEELGISLEDNYKIKIFNDPLDEEEYVIKQNLMRRQLTDGQKIVLLRDLRNIESKKAAQRYQETIPEKGEKGFQPVLAPIDADIKKGRTREIVTENTDLSVKTFERGNYILDNGTEEQKERMIKGEAVSKIEREIRKEEKREELENIAPLVQVPNGVELIPGDFMKADIKNNSVDLIITDPPYGEEAIKLYKDLGEFAKRVLKDGGSLITYAGQYTLLDVMNVLYDSGLKYWWTLCAIEGSTNTMIHPRKVFCTWKPILWYVKGEKSNNIDYMRDSMKLDVSKDLHKWEQPIDFVEKIIESLTVKNQVVLDPFMGSGTFGVAAHRLERNFIGIEKDEEVYNRAKGRISINGKS